MLAIRPVTYEVETSLSPKRVLRKLDGDLIEHRPTINILSQSKFMKNHRDDTIFYGYRTDAESFQIFHHTAKKRDGGSTGFYGKVEKTPNGTIGWRVQSRKYLSREYENKKITSYVGMYVRKETNLLQLNDWWGGRYIFDLNDGHIVGRDESGRDW